MNIHDEIASHFDAAADRARLQALADQHLADNRLPLPESVTERDAMIDAGVIEGPDDREIVGVIAEAFNMSFAAALDRLERIKFGELRAAA